MMSLSPGVKSRPVLIETFPARLGNTTSPEMFRMGEPPGPTARHEYVRSRVDAPRSPRTDVCAAIAPVMSDATTKTTTSDATRARRERPRRV